MESAVDPLGDAISHVCLDRVCGSDLDIVNAAKVSHGAFATTMGERECKLMRYLIEHNHWTPFEHATLTFTVKAPIFVVRQWFRHRSHSYNEISYRYTQAKDETYIPKLWRKQDTRNKQGSAANFEDEELLREYNACLRHTMATYKLLLDRGVAREMARIILPVATYTEFIFTTNLRNLFHFLELRMAIDAQWEIRQYANAIMGLAKEKFPMACSLWEDRVMSVEALVVPSVAPVLAVPTTVAPGLAVPNTGGRALATEGLALATEGRPASAGGAIVRMPPGFFAPIQAPVPSRVILDPEAIARVSSDGITRTSSDTSAV